MDDPNEGVLVLTFNKSELKLHRYCFNLTPSEQLIIMQRIMPVVTQESFAFEREMAKQEAAVANEKTGDKPTGE